MADAERPRSDVVPIALIVLLGLAARAWLAWSTPLIGTDSALFLWNAEEWDAEGWRAAIRFSKHPLYPFLIWLSGGICGGYERAGLAVSVVLGALQVVPIFLLGRRLAGRGAGIAAGVLLALHPHSCRLGGDVMTEGAYYLFLTSALWFGYVAGADRKWGAAILAGVFAGLAYLTRPEGALVAGMAGAWIVGSGLRAWRGMLLRGALLTLAFAVVIFPYLLGIRVVAGKWLLTKKGADVQLATQSIPGTEIPTDEKKQLSRFERYAREHGWWSAIAREMGRKTTTLFKLYLLPLALALVLARVSRPWSDRSLSACLAVATLAWLAFFVWVFRHLLYLSDRYLLTLVVTTLPWMGAGSAALLAWMARRFPAGGRPAAIALVVLFLGGTLVETLKPQRRDQMGLREAGEWIRSQGGGRDVGVLSANDKTAYYSGGRLLFWPQGPFAYIREKALPHVRYIAATEEEALAQTPDFPLAGVPGELERVWASDDHGKGPVVIWKVVDQR